MAHILGISLACILQHSCTTVLNSKPHYSIVTVQCNCIDTISSKHNTIHGKISRKKSQTFANWRFSASTWVTSDTCLHDRFHTEFRNYQLMQSNLRDNTFQGKLSLLDFLSKFSSMTATCNAVQCGLMIQPIAKVSEQVNRKCPARNMTVQISTHYTDPEPSNSTTKISRDQCEKRFTVLHDLD